MRAHHWPRRLAALVVLVSLVLGARLPQATPAEAASFTVNSTADEPDANSGDGLCVSTPSGVCTLRAALQEANSLGGAHTINLPAGTYLMTRNHPFGPLSMSSDVTLLGAGAATTTINSNGGATISDPPVLQVQSGATVSVSGVTLTGAYGVSTVGGGVVNSGTLTLDGVIVTGNFLQGDNSTAGGIANSGSLTITNSVISNNRAKYIAGISSSGPLTIMNSTISDNRELIDLGGNTPGGISATSDTVLTGVTVANNVSVQARPQMSLWRACLTSAGALQPRHDPDGSSAVTRTTGDGAGS
jgi:CSLREA domain-containing protein